MAWQWPEVLGAAACLSSTFSHRDDLVERVLTEPKSKTKFYIDSGWPGDNYGVTLAMGVALQSRGYVPGLDFLQLAFPLEGHEEEAWGRRLHLPLQLFWGKVSMAVRGRNEWGRARLSGMTRGSSTATLRPRSRCHPYVRSSVSPSTEAPRRS